MYTTRKSATAPKSLTSCLNSSSLKRNGGQVQLPKLNTRGLLSFKKSYIRPCLPSKVTTGVFGALSPTNASSPREIHRCPRAVFTKVSVANVGPQSSYLNFGFWVIVTRSPSFSRILFASPGATIDNIRKTRVCISI
uniref:Uncharacterized protein n=1 Tax=Anguilla anguilla TaxID=7936 RepID=A0A0E9X3T9_ANGAN